MSASEPLQRSPLHEEHLKLGGRIVPFAGWEMPVQYSGIIDEHKAVREGCGVFDISHMGQFFVRGGGALHWLNGLLSNNVAKLNGGEAQYTFLLNDRGGVIDDLIVYRLGEAEFLLIVNAARIDEDAAWMREHLSEGIGFEDQSKAHGALAIQGPGSPAVFEKILGSAGGLPKRNGVVRLDVMNGPVYICRTGYTGEDGFELVAPADGIAHWLHQAIAAGAKPCGLGCRDSLRLEMGYPLNGSDLSPERTPLEAGLGFFVDLDKGDFVGRETLARQKAEGVAERLTGFRMIDRGPAPRAHFPVLADCKIIGEISSGGVSPSLGIGIGMAYLPVAFSKIDTPLQIDIRGRQLAAVVARKPFYRKD